MYQIELNSSKISLMLFLIYCELQFQYLRMTTYSSYVKTFSDSRGTSRDKPYRCPGCRFALKLSMRDELEKRHFPWSARKLSVTKKYTNYITIILDFSIRRRGMYSYIYIYVYAYIYLL